MPGEDQKIEIAYLIRRAYLETCTLGSLFNGGRVYATIERPWIPTMEHRGGKARESCVPDGVYELAPHTGPRFKDVYSLAQPDLDVNIKPGRVGRYAILIHVGNYVRDVVGCIAVGMSHRVMDGQNAVTQSGLAMSELKESWKDSPPLLTIRPCLGSADRTLYPRPLRAA